MHAKLPLTTISVNLPVLEESSTETSAVREMRISGFEEQVLVQTQNKVSLDLEYDVNISLSIKDLFKKYAGLEIVDQQADFGFGVGAAGLNVKEEISHNVRLRTDQTPFIELENDFVLGSSTDRDYIMPYANIYYDFSPNDEWNLGVTGKFYVDANSNDGQLDVDANSNDGQLDVDGYMIGGYVRYYPTTSKWF